MKPSLVFVGFMGAGKSTALAAARAEGLSTTEIDELMEASFGSTIPQAFEAHGEEGFREREAEVVGSLLEKADDGGAIALGGGSVLSPRIREAMAATPSSGCRSTPPRPGAGSPTPTGPWRATPRTVGTLLADPPAALRSSSPTRWCRWGTAAIVRRALPMLRKLADLPAGTKMLWASAPAASTRCWSAAA